MATGELLRSKFCCTSARTVRWSRDSPRRMTLSKGRPSRRPAWSTV